MGIERRIERIEHMIDAKAKGDTPYMVTLLICPADNGGHISPSDAEVDAKLEQLKREHPGKNASMLIWLSSERRFM